MTIEDALTRLRDVQTTLNAESADAWGDDPGTAPTRFAHPDDGCARLSVVDVGGMLVVEYYGASYTGWPIVEAALADPGIAPHLLQLKLGGPDEGANGLKDWNFAGLIAAGTGFPNLVDCQIAISDPGDHNQACVVEDQLPALLARMPALRNLVLPQAPEPAFFDLAFPDLKTIRTGGDYRTRGFIDHLADARGLPALVFVDFTDSLAPFLDCEPQPAEWSSTPFADYERLFESAILDQFWGLRLRNTALTEAQYRVLQLRRPKLQFSAVLAPPLCYVSHWDKSRFPHAHLLPFG